MLAKKILSLLFGILLFFTITSMSFAAQRSPRMDYRVESGSPNAQQPSASSDETCRGRCNRLEQECIDGCDNEYIDKGAHCISEKDYRLKRGRNNEEKVNALQRFEKCIGGEYSTYEGCTDDCNFGGSECRYSCPD